MFQRERLALSFFLQEPALFIGYLMAPKDFPTMCRSLTQLHRCSMSSLAFLLIFKYYSAHRRLSNIPFYADKEKVPAAINQDQ